MKKKFELTKNHLKLLKNSYWIYMDDVEFGAPAIDPKRPYGNSDVDGDLEELLPNLSRKELREIHRELATACEIIMKTKSFKLGQYVADEYDNNWTFKMDLKDKISKEKNNNNPS